MARSLSRRYTAALLLVALLSISAWFSLRMVISEQKSTAAVVNVSGRQRMLSQRTALFSNLLAMAPADERPHLRGILRESIELMARSHRGLTHGDPASGLPGTMSETVYALYFRPPVALDAQVSAYIDAVRRLLLLEDEALTPEHALLSYIARIAPGPLLAALDHMVHQYQTEGEAAVQSLERAETALLAITLSLLLMEALLIFRPFVKQMKSVVGKLHGATEALRIQQSQLDDILERRSQELGRRTRELAESEEKFRLVSLSAHDAIIIADAQERTVFWNPAAEKLFGYTANEAMGKSVHDFIAPMPYRDAAPGTAENPPFEPAVGSTFEAEGLAQNGERIPVELSISAFALHEREHTLSIIRDIRERKAAEAVLRDSEERLRFVLEGAELGLWDWNLLTGEVKRNERWAKMLGYRYEELEGSTRQWSDFVHPDDRARAWDSIRDALEGRSAAHKQEYRMLHKDGSVLWILDQAKVMQRDAQGRALRMSGIHSDITERKLREQSLRLHQFTLNHAQEEVFWVGKDAKILDANEPACQMLGYSREEMLSLSVPDIDPCFPMETWAEHWQELKSKGTLRFESMQRTRDGRQFPIEIVANYMEYEGTEYNCALARDISERKRFETELELRANTDFLTQVGNRRHFMEEAERERARATRYGTPLSLMMLDIDFFKRINDTYGHAAGDETLRQIADACRQNLREVDIVGRMGGEEFAVLLPETDLQAATEAAERLRLAIAQVAVATDIEPAPTITASIGVSALRTEDDSLDSLLTAADNALYEAKRGGRNRVCAKAARHAA